VSAAAILVVDDDAASRELATDILETHGHAVIALPDGRGALGHLAAHPCDLILSDMRMPGLDGLGLLQALQRKGPHPPVIIATAYASIEHAVEAVKAGAYDYITKPFHPDRLARLVAKALEEERLRRENAMERAVALAEGDTIRPEHLPPLVRGAVSPPAAGTLTDLIANAIRRALAETGGNRRAAARLLGIPERTFYRKLKTLGLSPSVPPSRRNGPGCSSPQAETVAAVSMPPECPPDGPFPGPG
jgi:DNA-binding NtrC family response regulator